MKKMFTFARLIHDCGLLLKYLKYKYLQIINPVIN